MIEAVKENEFISIKVSKKIGPTGIRQIKEYAKFLEKTLGSPQGKKKVLQSKINEIADEINKTAWGKLKKKRGIV